MNQIEIHDIQELIDKNYPIEIIQKLLNDVLTLSMKVKNDYPDYRNWYQTIQNTTDGIWVGTGLSDQNILKLSRLTKEMEKKRENDGIYDT